MSTHQSRLESLQRSFAEHTRRLGEAQTTIANLKTSAASQHTSFRLELERLEEENRILIKRSEDRDAAIADREAELEHQATTFSQKEAAWQEKLQRAEEARQVAEKRADDFKITVERLAVAGGDGRHDISPAATLAARQRESGKSYTQFFTDYTIMETKLREVEAENVRLTDLLTEISQDLAEKVGKCVRSSLTSETAAGGAGCRARRCHRTRERSRHGARQCPRFPGRLREPRQSARGDQVS